MAAWKVLVIGLLAVICLSLATATVLVPLSVDAKERWGWLGGLLAGTVVMGALFVLFLRYADKSFDVKPRR